MNNKNNRPTCSTPNCNKLCQLMNTNKNTGHITWRKTCTSCHNTKTAAKHGLKNISQIIAKNAGYDSVAKYLNSKAKEKGFSGMTAYRNSLHPARSNRKDYCENIDGRLGYKCTYPTDLPTINGEKFTSHLQVDHINGNPKDNSPENLQTLCACCHSFKTALNKDYMSPGRKTFAKIDPEVIDTLFTTEPLDSINVVSYNNNEGLLNAKETTASQNN